MPSMEVFEGQTKEYKDSVIEPFVNVVTLEASNDSNWYKYANNNENVININMFGTSAKTDDVLEYTGFSYTAILQKIENILK